MYQANKTCIDIWTEMKKNARTRTYTRDNVRREMQEHAPWFTIHIDWLTSSFIYIRNVLNMYIITSERLVLLWGVARGTGSNEYLWAWALSTGLKGWPAPTGRHLSINLSMNKNWPRLLGMAVDVRVPSLSYMIKNSSHGLVNPSYMYM